jgi:hypothetical protein
MPLLTDPIRFREPRRHFVIDLVDARKSKRVKMIPRRKSFDPAKARMFEAARQNHVAIHPVPANHKRCKTHSDLKGDSRFLW